MKKNVLIVLFFYSSVFYSQVKTDTVYFVLNKFVQIDNIQTPHVYFIDGKFYQTKKTNKRTEYGEEMLSKFKSNQAHFVFVNKRRKKIEEGVWNGEHYLKGVYKLYYKSGQLKEIGEVDDGNKIGTWKYYNKKGKLIKEDKY